MTNKSKLHGLGIALGAALGAVFGVLAGHMGVWLAMGVAIGVKRSAPRSGARKRTVRNARQMHRNACTEAAGIKQTSKGVELKLDS